MEHLSDILGGGETVRGPARIPKDSFVGTILDGRYFIEQKLGQGAFGAVYLALDQKIVSRKVVIKILRDEAKNDWSNKKFKQEIEALTRVNHPNIVGILDSGEIADDKPYIVMQYVNGVALRSLIKPEGMDLWRASNIIAQMCRALHAAHECGVLHRDLKPENVMLENITDEDEHVKIIDFGVAKVANSIVAVSTVTNQTVGTIAYMSPEQLKARRLTPASDVYSLGAIAYEMLTGRRPMNPDSVFQLLELQRSGVRVKPTDLRPSLPPAADLIILKALSFDPKDRYERARDFGDLLSSALNADDAQVEQQSEAQGSNGRFLSETETLSLQMADVLFVDVVGYSNPLTGEQTEHLRQFQEMVMATNECRLALKDKTLTRLPLDKGMALAFFGDPQAPVRCALEISRAVKDRPEIELRMGVHSGFVYPMANIATNMTVIGGGIGIAQILMECGDSGHILLSKRVADDLKQLAQWSGYLHDLGDQETMPGVPVHVYSLYGDDFGNPALPAQFQIASPIYKKMPLIAAAALTILALAVGGIWYAARSKTPVVNQPTKPVTTAAVGPEQSLTYWLTVQEMLNNKPLGKPVDSAGDNVFRGGSWFQFNVRPIQSGALYLLDAGPGKNGSDEYHILFPLSKDRLDPKLAADQTGQSFWNQFDENTGVEKLWIIWSTQPLPDLDRIFEDAVRNTKGVITKADHIAEVDVYLKKYTSAPPELVPDKLTKRTSLKGKGDILVSRVELSHYSY